jgi:hypothetical protein
VPKRRPPFERDQPRLRQQPTIVVLCEDSKSSVDYLDDIKIHLRVHLHVKISHPGVTDPRGIIRAAVKQSKTVDHVYCVIDRDSHAHFEEAVASVSNNPKITVIPSYPCFEYWLLLHFVYSRKPYNVTGKKSAAECLIDDLKAHADMAAYAKGDAKGLYERLGPARLAIARKNASISLAQALKEGSLNPSTRIHLLVEFMESLVEPSPTSLGG